ncbi:hypothetical protein MASR1M8_05350 [Thermomonas brevis]
MRRRIGWSIAALMLAACARPADTGTQAPAGIAQGAAATDHLLPDCRDTAFLASGTQARLARLAAVDGLHCAATEDDEAAIHCSGHGARAFGLPLRAVDVWASDSPEPGLSLRFDDAPAVLREALAKALGRPLREDPDLGGAWDLESATDPVTWRVLQAEDGPGTVVACSRTTDAAAAAAIRVPAGWARLSGMVSYPSEELPPTRVCAIRKDDPGTGYCTELPANAPDWQLAVPPGRWTLWAWPERGLNDGRPGRHSQASSCIAEVGEGCDAHAMRPVEAAAGEARSGLMINDWYADPADGEEPPHPPRGEAVPAG